MAIDTTPSTVATNALQAIPFSSLIGGPLDACIKAQAQAAKTSWEFINEVGLTIDPQTNEKKAITVAFQYNNNGQMTTLVVPLLILLPIPYMAINEVTIDFMANISAASSSVQETSEDTELGVGVDATASLKVGPFSLDVSVKANYSAKSHSKAAQESRYSVEYTMQIHVAGGQADMPAGLQTVLNILSASVGSVSSGDMVTTFPKTVLFNQTEDSTLQVTVKNNFGVLAEGANVALEYDGLAADNPFQTVVVARGVDGDEVDSLLERGFNNSTMRAHRRLYGIRQRGTNLVVEHQGRRIAASRSRGMIGAPNGVGDVAAPVPLKNGVTDNSGQVSFKLTVKEALLTKDKAISGRLIVKADVPIVDPNGKRSVEPEPESIYVAFQIIPDGRLLAVIETTIDPLDFKTVGATKELTVTAFDARNRDQVLKGFLLTAELKFIGVHDEATVFDAIVATQPVSSPPATPVKASGTTDDNGVIKFTFRTKALPAVPKEGQIVITGDAAEDIVVDFSVDKAP